MRNKNVFWVGLIIVLIAAGVLGYLKYESRSKIQTLEFVGVIEKINEDSLTVKGFYAIDGESVTIDVAEPVEVVIKTNANTEFTKTVTYLPVGVAGESFSYTDLRKETVSGSLEDIRELELLGTGVTVTAANNIYKKSEFVATKIHYAADVTDIK